MVAYDAVLMPSENDVRLAEREIRIANQALEQAWNAVVAADLDRGLKEGLTRVFDDVRIALQRAESYLR